MPYAKLPNVPVPVVREQIRLLVAAGMSLAAIARATGLYPLTVEQINRGEGRYVQGHTAALIRAVVPVRTPPLGLVDAVGSCRRAQALARAGYTQRDQVARCGLERRGFWSLIHGAQKLIGPANAAALDRMFQDLRDTPGPSAAAVACATRHGWPGPDAWDDDTIDDPDALPYAHLEVPVVDGVAVARALAGDRAVRLTAAERHEAIRVGVLAGMARERLSRHLGVRFATVAEVHRELVGSAA
jgi:hypothetical protein